MKVYVIAKGIKKGFYFDWNDVQPLVNKYPGARHKSFAVVDDAIKYLRRF